MKKGRGRPKKNPPEIPNMAMEKGNSAFNLNDAEETGLTEADLVPPVEMNEVDFTEIDKKVLTPAASAITPEDLAFEAELQSMDSAPLEFTEADMSMPITKEPVQTEFLGDYVDNYKPADSQMELDRQVYTAQSMGLTAIEATDDVIRFYTKASFDVDRKLGYFIYKNIRVFFVGEFRKFVSRDKRNMFTEIRLPG